MACETDTESNTGVSDVSGMEMNKFHRPARLSESQCSRQDQGNILVYSLIGIGAVAACVFGLHAGVARVLFPQAKHHHRWSGSATVSNDVQLERENNHPTFVEPLGNPDIGKGPWEKNFPYAFALRPNSNGMESIPEQEFRQAIHKIHIHLMAMEKAGRLARERFGPGYNGYRGDDGTGI